MDKESVLLGVALGGLASLVAFLCYKRMTQTLQLKQVQENEETWEWVDWQGRERKITVHRQVKGNV